LKNPPPSVGFDPDLGSLTEKTVMKAVTSITAPKIAPMAEKPRLLSPPSVPPKAATMGPTSPAPRRVPTPAKTKRKPLRLERSW